MTDHKLDIKDDAAPEDATADPAVPERSPYEVTAESGLFKNGKQYDAGDTVLLDEQTAARFIENGDVKETSA